MKVSLLCLFAIILEPTDRKIRNLLRLPWSAGNCLDCHDSDKHAAAREQIDATANSRKGASGSKIMKSLLPQCARLATIVQLDWPKCRAPSNGKTGSRALRCPCISTYHCDLQLIWVLKTGKYHGRCDDVLRRAKAVLSPEPAWALFFLAGVGIKRLNSADDDRR